MLLTRLTLTLHLQKPLVFTCFPGFYLRNALVKAMTVHCRNQLRKREQMVTDCKGCKYTSHCIYYRLNLPVMEPEEKPGVMPFRIEAGELITGKYQQGDVTFGMTLFGHAAEHIDELRDAWVRIGSEYGLGDEGADRSFTVGKEMAIQVENSEDILTREYPETNRLSLQFRHLRLSQKKMETKPVLPFQELINQIMLRLHALGDAYGEENLRTGLSEADNLSAGDITHEERWVLCNYQYPGNRQGYWFLNGQSVYKGHLSPFLPLLHLGSQTGIGRFTSYGFGNYIIKV